MAISPETIEEVIKTANVYDVVSDYLDLKRVGSSYTTLCPFHAEKTPSFYVSPEKNIWKCFGCGKGGDSVKFVMDYEGLSFTEAILKLAEKYGIEIRYTDGTKDSQRLKGLFNVSRKIADFYKQSLKNSPEAKNYLFNRRNLSFDTAKLFEIGYSPEDVNELLSFCKRENISLEDLKNIGVLVEKEGKLRDRFSGRVIFPIKDIRGRVVAFGGRKIKDFQNPKYINSPETELYRKREVLYGLYEAKNYIREKKKVIVVEGYLDVLSLYQIGIRNVVATLGTSLSKYHAKQLKKFAEEVVLMFDSDDAGKKAVISASKVFLLEDIDVKYIPLPEGEDPDSIARKGYNETKRFMENAEDIFIFLLNRIKETEKSDIKDENLLKKRYKLINLYLDLLGHVRNTAKRVVYHKALSDVTGLPIESLTFKEVQVQQGEDDLENKELTLREKIVLKALLYHKEDILKFVEDFSKISDSGYFLHLVDLILNGKLSEDEYKMIDSFNVKYDLNTAVESINLMKRLHYKKSISVF